ncbi:hypothetical protein CC78DRAFT_604239 [Lojkania enalia]|uniref:MARVEL domain-containing protein n=1 Tax=Lojkania enalia TaxID=147567 RepID=A0A9P4NAB2_9PLEO|nr:hypothetical protein CC78DRAFT_604239 [Didymosphaeria enalia]
MIITRILFLTPRFGQFITSTVVLGLSALFLHTHLHDGAEPFGRAIYAVIVTALSVLFSLVGMIPLKSSITSYTTDFFFSSAIFAVFGLYVIGSIGLTAGRYGTGKSLQGRATTAASGMLHRLLLSLRLFSGLLASL